ncbi:MAG TPA: carboxylating nicotinate-nucleotide diphosphorylase [Burkholderiales bacterium]|nr:carboxylating nicotinate-nucleotide diphosphorylase [Burkholderiales bacterium]
MRDLDAEIERNVAAAFAEDVAGGDLTAELIPENHRTRATLLSHSGGTLCGCAWFDCCFRTLDARIEIGWSAQDGNLLAANQTICTINGNARAILTAERSALNFLQTLSATATATRKFVEAVRGTKAVIMDTRKTLPGLRAAQKYAVKIGGGQNQRTGLDDGILIKENHIAMSQSIAEVLEKARKSEVPVQIEVENLSQLEEALGAGAKLILLDNFSSDDLRAAVQFNSGRATLEASGGITLANVRAIAETGVDRISIGSLTKDVNAVDLSLRIRGLGTEGRRQNSEDG